MGGLPRREQKGKNRIAVIHLDFSYMQTRQCGDEDVEKWYAQGVNGTECIMGHKVFDQWSNFTISDSLFQQWFWRKKAGVDCYMGDQYMRPEPDREDCLCTDVDYGWYELFSKDGWFRLTILQVTTTTSLKGRNAFLSDLTLFLPEPALGMTLTRPIKCRLDTAFSLEIHVSRKEV
jgi:hypothetical protein